MLVFLDSRLRHGVSGGVDGRPRAGGDGAGGRVRGDHDVLVRRGHRRGHHGGDDDHSAITADAIATTSRRSPAQLCGRDHGVFADSVTRLIAGGIVARRRKLAAIYLQTSDGW